MRRVYTEETSVLPLKELRCASQNVFIVENQARLCGRYLLEHAKSLT